ncbi:hypothetical protein [Rhodopila sp.]|jgi:hypothetical protein|uniref:hypothetical protein n=1 Tax=Rhodopila sp. TaxID=2480087 RepID=UPI002BA93B78|nr:hypothetical protein [Rhodopila sp.]HVZ09434.1 hypothetical protein [Rhodopila sp.]
MLQIQTFDARAGGNVIYKALAHPLAAEAIRRLYAAMPGPVAIYDPDGLADALMAMYPTEVSEVFVHDVTLVGTPRAGRPASPLTGLPSSSARTILIAAFDAGRIAARIAHMVPRHARIVTLDEARLPETMLSNRGRYLDKVNFATNFAFFRDADGMSSRLVSANYWANYGATTVRLWLRLFAGDGSELATWEAELPEGPGGFSIDSRAVRERFGLAPFTGQLFVHAIGVAGHDVVKYALDTYASDNGASLSCTHDANAWPSDRFAGLPAPRPDETVVLWLQNSHAVPIPAGAVSLDRMGSERPVALQREVGPFATVALDVADFLPGLQWPEQIELRAGRHVVRPRYEVTRQSRVRIAHMNVERDNLKPDPGIPALPAAMGRGYILPFPILPKSRFRSIVQPTPMATTQRELPIRMDVFDSNGTKQAESFLGRLPRDRSIALDLDAYDVEEGHAELVYDFREGGEADGWLHALFRYEDRQSGHVAESSFGAHIFNTAMTYRDEPQSYSGPPPGLSTRLFLKLGDGRRHSFATLIYPASGPWHPVSSTSLLLHDGTGRVIAEAPVAIACSGSATVWPHRSFAAEALQAAGPGGYVLIRDATCRLFGYHGLMDEAGGFSLDHMFGF